MLRRGLVEEVAEFLEELPASGQPDKGKVTGELGDILWYVSEISRHRGLYLGSLMPGASTMGDAQTIINALPTVATIVDHEGEILDPTSRAHDALAVVGLRVVDVLNPKNDELWLGHADRPRIDKALFDLMQCAAILATKHSVQLDAAAVANLEKLRTRSRRPHVIEEAGSPLPLSSMRDRLAMNPWVRSLLYNRELSRDIARFPAPEL